MNGFAIHGIQKKKNYLAAAGLENRFLKVFKPFCNFI